MKDIRTYTNLSGALHSFLSVCDRSTSMDVCIEPLSQAFGTAGSKPVTRASITVIGRSKALSYKCGVEEYVTPTEYS